MNASRLALEDVTSTSTVLLGRFVQQSGVDVHSLHAVGHRWDKRNDSILS